MKRLVLSVALALVLVLAPTASAHRLSISRADVAAERDAGDVASRTEDEHKFVFDIYAENCRRRSSHSVRCTGGMLILEWEAHSLSECSWRTTVSFRSSRSRDLRTSRGRGTCGPVRRSLQPPKPDSDPPR